MRTGIVGAMVFQDKETKGNIQKMPMTVVFKVELLGSGSVPACNTVFHQPESQPNNTISVHHY